MEQPRGKPIRLTPEVQNLWLAVYPAMLASTVVDMLAKPAVLVTGLVWAAAILLYRRSTGGSRRHYVAAAAVVAGLAPLPAPGVVDAGAPAMTLWLAVMGGLYTPPREVQAVDTTVAGRAFATMHTYETDTHVGTPGKPLQVIVPATRRHR